MEEQNVFPQVDYVVSAAPRQRLTVQSDKKDRLGAWVLYALCVALADALLFCGGNLGFAVTAGALFILSLFYLLAKGQKVRAYPLFCGIAAAALAVPFALYDNGFDRFFAFCVIAGLAALYAVLLSGSEWFDAGTFRTIGDVGRAYFLLPFVHIDTAMRSLFSRNKEEGNKRRLLPILLGIVIALPVLLIVVPLLSSSNPFFETLVKSGFENIGKVLIRLAFGAVLFPFAFSALFTCRHGLQKREEPAAKTTGKVDPLIANSFLSAVSVVYVVYLVSQIAYFFSAFSKTLPAGYTFTFAEYARQGFFEMCAVAAINLILIFLVLWLVKKDETEKVPVFTKVLCTFMCLFTLLLIATALSKMVMYIDGYGMTRLRVLASCFMVLLAVVFILALVRVFRPSFPYMKGVVIAGCVVMLVMGFADVDTVVSRYNVHAYQTGALKTVDVDTLANLSDAAVPSLIELLDDDDVDVADAANNALVDYLFEHYDVICTAHGEENVCEREWEGYHYYPSEYVSPYEEGGNAPEPCTAPLTLEPYKKETLWGYNRAEYTARELLLQNKDRILK